MSTHCNAAGLNSCLNQIERLIASSGGQVTAFKELQATYAQQTEPTPVGAAK